MTRLVDDLRFLACFMAGTLVGIGGGWAKWSAADRVAFFDHDRGPEKGTHPAVHFAPGPACREEAVRVLSGASRTVRLSAYALTSPPILEALQAAARRGVDVRVLVDRSNDGRAALEDLRAAGVVVLVDRAEPIQHEKLVEVDGRTVLLGSANWSPSSERDHEVCATFVDEGAAATIVADWEHHAAHAER